MQNHQRGEGQHVNWNPGVGGVAPRSHLRP